MIKRVADILGEINEVRKGLWGVYFYLFIYFYFFIVRFGR